MIPALLKHVPEGAGIPVFSLPDGVRRSVRGESVIWVDWNEVRVTVERVRTVEL